MKILLTFFQVVAVLLTISCATAPIKSSSRLPVVKKHLVKADEGSDFSDATKVDLRDLKSLSKKAGHPAFGMIMGFYQLPSTRPAGAVVVTESEVFGEPYRSFWFKETISKPYAVLPVSPYQLEALVAVMNKLLDANIRIKEVPLADALKVMKAEKKAMKSGKEWMPSRTLSSGVDLLISVQKGYSETQGRIYSGRILSTKDGRLLALGTWPDTGVHSLSPLIDKLVYDALRRLND